MPMDILPEYSQNHNVSISGMRGNFRNYQETPINRDCSIDFLAGPGSELGLLKHDCDTGNGSSGASLGTVIDGKEYSLGVHIGGVLVSDDDYNTTNRGNYLIPSQRILEAVEHPEIWAALLATSIETDRASVAELQLFLNDLGYDAGAVDGLYGGKTANALDLFREENGMTGSNFTYNDQIAIRAWGIEPPNTPIDL